MGLLRLSSLLVVLLIACTNSKAQTTNIIVQPAWLQKVGDTVTVSVWIQSATPVSNVFARSYNTNTSTNVQKALTYDPASGFYTGRFPFTGFPDGILSLSLGGSSGISGTISVIHDASLVITPDALPQIVLNKPAAYSVANPLLPVKAAVTDNADSARLIFTFFTPSFNGNYWAAGTWWDSVDTNLDFSAYYGQSLYLLIQAIDSNQQLTALKPIPLFVESSPFLIKHFVGDGRILDFNYNKLLVIDDGPQSGPRIIDVPGGASVAIPFVGKVTTGYLTPQGAVLSTINAGQQDVDSLYDYNNGTLYPVNVLTKGSLKVAGNYCTWTHGNSGGLCNVSFDSLLLRDLVNKTDVIVTDSAGNSANGRPTINSLHNDGSVMYVGPGGNIRKYINGLNTVLVNNDPCSQRVLGNPVHDSFSYAYTFIDAHMTNIIWNGYFIFSESFNVERRPGLDYQVNGKYMAYTNIPLDNQLTVDIYRADTFFNRALLTNRSRYGTYLELLNPEGDLMFIAIKRSIAFQTGGITDISSTLGKTYYRNSAWYITIGNTLYKLNFDPPQDTVINDTLEVIKGSPYRFAKEDFVNNFGPSPLISVKIAALPLHGTLTNDGIPVLVNDVIIRADLNKLVYQPDNDFTATDTIQWNGSNGLSYANTGGLFKMIIISPPAKPAITGVLSNYCDNQGAQKVKISNWPANTVSTSVSAKLDATPLSVNAADSSVTFNVNGLTAGLHSITVTFTNIAGVNDTIATTNVATTVTPDVNVSANITNVVNLTTPVIVTATNAAGGGTAPLYTFARDKGFTNILQTEGTIATLSIDPATLVIGDNKVYVRMKTSATCYTTQTNVDSILLRRDAATGIVDVDNPGQLITVFPNPFGSKITVNGLSSGKAYRIVLYNVRGQAVYTSEVKNKRLLDIPASGILPGVYWLTIYDTKKRPIGTEKIIKH